ncbi:hypothetical protein [Thalassospira marina]|nr:hypothetical protein [Thalassospira marina]
MPSKGMDLYGYTPETSIPVSFAIKQPGASHTTTYDDNTPGTIFNRHIEVNTDLPFHISGDYSMSAAGISRSCEVNGLTGNISDSNMDNMLANQQAAITPNAVVSYGFYDAGSGYDDISYTSHHQNYAYTGDGNRPDWMTKMVAGNSNAGTKPFSAFVLPGAHDAGMNTSQNIAEVVSNIKKYGFIATAIFGSLALVLGVAIGAIVTVLSIAASSLIERVIINLSITQKDTITNMLNLGTRYFDFRPGYNAKIQGIPVASGDGLYHQHNMIPGMAFTDFLNETVAWLKAHPGEIVVVSLGFSGFYDDAMKPDSETLKNAINTALAGSDIVYGGPADTSSSYNDLIAAKKRLLFLNNGVGFNDASKYDSYSDGAYATLTPDPILNQLKQMHTTPDSGDVYTVLQLQGTASAVSALWPSLAACTSDATSPLLMTKAYFDSTTYPWTEANLASFNSAYPVVILNDFVDPQMSHIAEDATLLRAGQL